MERLSQSDTKKGEGYLKKATSFGKTTILASTACQESGKALLNAKTIPHIAEWFSGSFSLNEAKTDCAASARDASSTDGDLQNWSFENHSLLEKKLMTALPRMAIT